MQPKLHALMHRLLPNRTTHILFAAILFWTPFIVFVGLAHEVIEKEAFAPDTFVLTKIHTLTTPWLTHTVVLLTNLGGIIFILPITAIIVAALYAKKLWREARLLLAIVAGAGVVNMLLKVWFHRDRPTLWQALVHETSYSFPSGHAMASSALAFGVMALFWRTKWRWLVVAAGLLYMIIVGFTRLYLGVHFPSDILAGWCVSFLWTLIAYRILK